MSDDITFAEPARRPQQAAFGNFPMMQLANNARDQTLGPSLKDRRQFSGFLIQQGQDPLLDDILDNHNRAAVQAGKIPLLVPRTIFHPSSNREVQHWSADQAHAFIVTKGIQSRQEMQRSDERLGIAYAWIQHPQSGRPQSILRCRLFLMELLALGYAAPLVLTIKGTRTDGFLAAAVTHYDALDRSVELGIYETPPAYYGLALPLSVADTGTPQGAGASTTEVVPLVSKHPPALEMGEKYLRRIRVRPEWVEPMNTLLPSTVIWSAEESRQVALGLSTRPAGANGE